MSKFNILPYDTLTLLFSFNDYFELRNLDQAYSEIYIDEIIMSVKVYKTWLVLSADYILIENVLVWTRNKHIPIYKVHINDIRLPWWTNFLTQHHPEIEYFTSHSQYPFPVNQLLASFPHLKYLDCYENKINVFLPTNPGVVSRIRYFKIFDNYISKETLTSLFTYGENLEVLDVSQLERNPKWYESLLYARELFNNHHKVRFYSSLKETKNIIAVPRIKHMENFTGFDDYCFHILIWFI